MQPLQKVTWQLLSYTQTHLVAEGLRPQTHTQERREHTHTKRGAQVFTAAFLTTMKTPVHLGTGERKGVRACNGRLLEHEREWSADML